MKQTPKKTNYKISLRKDHSLESIKLSSPKQKVALGEK